MKFSGFFFRAQQIASAFSTPFRSFAVFTSFSRRHLTFLLLFGYNRFASSMCSNATATINATTGYTSDFFPVCFVLFDLNHFFASLCLSGLSQCAPFLVACVLPFNMLSLNTLNVWQIYFYYRYFFFRYTAMQKMVFSVLHLRPVHIRHCTHTLHQTRMKNWNMHASIT